MKYSFLLIVLCPAIAWSSVGEICNPEQDSKSFITDWNLGYGKTKVCQRRKVRIF